MKKVLFSICMVFSFLCSHAQEDTIPVYKRFPTIPPFKIMRLPDSTAFTKDDLQRRKPLIIILFSPDCEHCRHETHVLLDSIDLFKKAQIVMVSSLDYDLVKKFYDKNNIGNYPNITMGRDGAYFLGTFFKSKIYPSIFIYDKKGNFVKSFEGSVPVAWIAAEL